MYVIKEEIRHSDDIQDIITSPPSWILRWGVSVFFLVILLFLTLSFLIKYPDTVNAKLTIVSSNTPKAIISKIPGTVISILVKENQSVEKDQPLAFLESTANHRDVLSLISSLKDLQKRFSDGQSIEKIAFTANDKYKLGELQPAYQTFAQSLLSYQSAIKNGVFLKKKKYLENDLRNIQETKIQLLNQKTVEQQDLKIAAEDYEMNKKLEEEHVETPAELRTAESKYLSKKTPVIQINSDIINSNTNYSAKQKEILELETQISDEKSKFIQAINSLTSQAIEWKNKYVLSASQSGTVTFGGVVQENQVVQAGQEIFYISSNKNLFFGELDIPQANMGKVKEQQLVLIKLRSFPFEEYGMLNGRISSINEVPYKDSIYLSKVTFASNRQRFLKMPIKLKQGMLADAEIITADASLFKRISRNLLKLTNNFGANY